MLFTTAQFCLVFLPIVIIGYYIIGRFSPLLSAGWLFLSSVIFYGYWMPEFTLLLIASILLNFLVGGTIAKLDPINSTEVRRRQAKIWLLTGVAINLLLLGYFKYANFFIENINYALGFEWSLGKIILPIGISFYTFTQIAFLADAYSKGIKEYRFAHYGLFVTYFPHLIAGPVLHHAQMMPQFRNLANYRFNGENFSAGLCIFAIGLFKKIVLADGISPYADAVFNAAEMGRQPDTIEAWFGALAYTFQLYFDFSGYSDMAIGLSWMFNIRLPYNFNSPYKSLNISEFWKRWHMTLSAFLRDYLYIPLGGNREGSIRRYINLMTTMILGGLWHGANWTFVFWGTLHGAFLVINHAFQQCSIGQLTTLRQTTFFKILAWALTFFCTLFAWIFFRSTDFSTAIRIVSALVPDLNDSIYSVHLIFWNQGLDVERGAFWILLLGVIAFLMPNSNKFGELVLSKCQNKTIFVPLSAGFAVMSCLFLVLVNSSRDTSSAFIYFNF